MVYIQELLIYICIRVSRDTYNRRGMSNMQLNDGRPDRMARGREVVVPPLAPRWVLCMHDMTTVLVYSTVHTSPGSL